MKQTQTDPAEVHAAPPESEATMMTMLPLSLLYHNHYVYISFSCQALHRSVPVAEMHSGLATEILCVIEKAVKDSLM